MHHILAQRDALIAWLKEHTGGLVDEVTVDPAAVRPLPGRASILIEPPDLKWPSWNDPVIAWKIDVIAGTTATQRESLDLILDVIEHMIDADLNVDAAVPVTFSLAGAGDRAAYQITLNPLDFTED